MWWIFTYAAYATLAAVAIGAAGYAAVTQLALLQRLVVVTLEKWLRQVAANIDGTSNAFEVWHTDHGEQSYIRFLPGKPRPRQPVKFY